MVDLKNIKTQLIIFLSGLALYLSYRDNDATFLLCVFVAIFSAVAAESVILIFRDRKICVTESSVISGLIIGFVLSTDNPWWIILAASFLAISSKHLIHFHRKHLFNPAAFGIFLTIVLFGASTQWKGTYLWYVLVPFGLYFTHKVRRLRLLIGYALTALVLFGVQAFMQKTPLSNVFGYISYFFVFIMMIEPKTTPLKALGKFLFGLGVAALIFILTEFGVRFDAELASLLVLNLFVPALNRFPVRKKI